MSHIWKHTERNMSRVEAKRLVRSTRPALKGTIIHPWKEAAKTRRWDEEVECTLEIDQHKLVAHLAKKAINSRTGQSILLGGIVRLKIKKRMRINERVIDEPLGDGKEIVS